MGKVLGATVVAIGLAVGAVAAWPGPNPEEPPKPAAKPDKPDEKKADGSALRGRARLLLTKELDNPTGSPVWSPDGAALVIQEDKNLIVRNGRTLDSWAHVSTADAGTAVGFIRGKPTLVTYLSGPRRINTVTQLRFWQLYDATGIRFDRPTRAVDLDPTDGTPVAVFPDGRSVLAVAYDRSPATGGGYKVLASRFRRIDAETGEAKELVRVDGFCSGYALTADGRRLLVASFAKNDNQVVGCYDLATGKPVWTRTFDETVRGTRSYGVPSGQVSGSPDGSRVAVTLAQPAPQSQPGAGAAPFGPAGPGAVPGGGFVNTISLHDAATGEPGVKLEGMADGLWVGLGFSHDSRLFVGKSIERNIPRLRVWETATGKAVKTWDGASAAAVFAPDRPVLAVVEEYSEPGPPDPAGRQPLVAKATLGLWDLSALAK